MLKGKTIVLGVCGGIAVYKIAALVRLYVKAGAAVHVILTEAAQKFVTPLTFQTLSGHPVHTDLFDLWQEAEVDHISLADRADVFVVAPATANLVGKVAGGIADDLLTTTLMATRAPVLLVPSMNVHMYENPIYQANEARLRQHGYRVMEPACGFLACGYDGKGKLPEPEDILAMTEKLAAPQDLTGETLLITAGPTQEAIDPVRYLSNHSSGRMGYALAAAAWRRGARVILVSGPTERPAPYGVERVAVTSAAEMAQAVLSRLEEASIVIKAAAVADFRPRAVAPQKLKKGQQASMTLELERTSDILAEVGRRKGTRLVVGFAAETEALEANARRKCQEKHLDLIVANDVTAPDAGFGVDTNRVTLIDRSGAAETWPLLSKQELAYRLLDRIRRLRADG